MVSPPTVLLAVIGSENMMSSVGVIVREEQAESAEFKLPGLRATVTLRLLSNGWTLEPGMAATAYVPLRNSDAQREWIKAAGIAAKR
jgi:hypothetical protein